MGGEARLDKEEVELATTFGRGGCDKRAVCIKVCVSAPCLCLDKGERLSCAIQRHCELTMPAGQFLDGSFCDELTQIDDGYTGTDLLHLGEQVTRYEDGLAFSREAVHEVAHLDNAGGVGGRWGVIVGPANRGLPKGPNGAQGRGPLGRGG